MKSSYGRMGLFGLALLISFPRFCWSIGLSAEPSYCLNIEAAIALPSKDISERIRLSLHPLWKCIAQAVDDLEQREVDIADPAAGDPGAAAFAEQAFEIAGKFRNPLVPKFFRTFFGRSFLILVIEARGDRTIR